MPTARTEKCENSRGRVAGLVVWYIYPSIHHQLVFGTSRTLLRALSAAGIVGCYFDERWEKVSFAGRNRKVRESCLITESSATLRVGFFNLLRFFRMEIRVFAQNLSLNPLKTRWPLVRVERATLSRWILGVLRVRVLLFIALLTPSKNQLNSLNIPLRNRP